MTEQELYDYRSHLQQDEKLSSDEFVFYFYAGVCCAAVIFIFNFKLIYPVWPLLWFLSGMNKQKVANIQEELVHVQNVLLEKEKEKDHDD